MVVPFLLDILLIDRVLVNNIEILLSSKGWHCRSIVAEDDLAMVKQELEI